MRTAEFEPIPGHKLHTLLGPCHTRIAGLVPEAVVAEVVQAGQAREAVAEVLKAGQALEVAAVALEAKECHHE